MTSDKLTQMNDPGVGWSWPATWNVVKFPSPVPIACPVLSAGNPIFVRRKAVALWGVGAYIPCESFLKVWVALSGLKQTEGQ